MKLDFTNRSIEMDDELIKEAERILDYSFRNKQLLGLALMHSSLANELTGDNLDSNERLEFLGDAILEEIVSIYLYRQLPDKLEGVLTKTRSQIVCEGALAAVSKKTGLNKLLQLGKGERASGGSERDSIISDGVEALIGAVYLDGGQEAARALIFRLLGETIDLAIAGRLGRDSKSELQEKLQVRGNVNIAYKIVEEDGPSHDKIFTAAVLLDGAEIGRGTGRSKQLAEAAAAADALDDLR